MEKKSGTEMLRFPCFDWKLKDCRMDDASIQKGSKIKRPPTFLLLTNLSFKPQITHPK